MNRRPDRARDVTISTMTEPVAFDDVARALAAGGFDRPRGRGARLPVRRSLRAARLRPRGMARRDRCPTVRRPTPTDSHDAAAKRSDRSALAGRRDGIRAAAAGRRSSRSTSASRRSAPGARDSCTASARPARPSRGTAAGRTSPRCLPTSPKSRSAGDVGSESAESRGGAPTRSWSSSFASASSSSTTNSPRCAPASPPHARHRPPDSREIQ